MKYYKYIKIILIAIPVFILFFLINKQFPINGKLELVYNFSKPHALIHKLTPDGRLSEIKKEGDIYYQTIKNNPVYFDIELPDDYQKASIKLKYKNKNQPVIEIGGMVNSDLWNFELKPVQNTIIDDLYTKWHKITEGEIIFLQKEKYFDKISEFIKNLPPTDEIAIFNYDLPYNYVYPNYKPRAEYQEIKTQLVGNHSFYTYLGENEKLDFNFLLKPINNQKENNVGKIEIYKEKEKVYSYGFNLKEDKNIIIKSENFKSGYYKISLIFDDNILIDKIKTKQKLISFIGVLKFFEKSEPINLVSSSLFIKVATDKISGLQTIKIDNQKLIVDNINSEFVQKNNSKLSNIQIKKGGIIIRGDGLFSFNKNQFFNPKINNLDKEKKLNNINYIIANYQSPKLNSDTWVTSKTDVDLTKLAKKNNKIKIMFSAPNLKENKGEIKIREIKIILEQKPLWKRIKNKLFKLIL